MSEPRPPEVAAARRRWIVRRGVVGWGVPTGVLFSLGMHYWGAAQLPFLGTLAIALVAFPIGGWVWGAWMWRWLERRGGADTLSAR